MLDLRCVARRPYRLVALPERALDTWRRVQGAEEYRLRGPPHRRVRRVEHANA